MQEDYRTVKVIRGRTYEVRLVELPSGAYCIISGRLRSGEPLYSDTFRDYSLASYAFDVKVKEMEGN